MSLVCLGIKSRLRYPSPQPLPPQSLSHDHATISIFREEWQPAPSESCWRDFCSEAIAPAPQVEKHNQLKAQTISLRQELFPALRDFLCLVAAENKMLNKKISQPERHVSSVTHCTLQPDSSAVAMWSHNDNPIN